MTYQVGNILVASEINSFLSSVRDLYGVGSGDRGYGQTQYTLSALASGDKVTSAQLTDLRNALAVLRQSQTGSVPSLVPPTSVLDAGDLVVAHESSAPSSNAYDFNSVIADADANRSAANSLSSGVVSGTSSATRSGTWGSGSGGIQLVFDVTWPTTDEARYFFNTGGQIRINLSHPTGTSQDNNWNSALSTRVGQINVLSHVTAIQGSMGTSAALGYFEATSSIQTIFNDVVVGTSPYAANLLRLQYQVLGSASNGGPGSGLRFTIRLIDAHTNAFSDSVASGTAAAFGYAKNSYLTNPTLTTPSGSVNAAWSVV